MVNSSSNKSIIPLNVNGQKIPIKGRSSQSTFKTMDQPYAFYNKLTSNRIIL